MKKLRIGKYLVSTSVNGPGKRFVIWFQGCPFRCEGCFNQELIEDICGTFFSIHEIIDRINTAGEIEGVTFSGGDPLFQAEGLLPLAELIKSKGLSIVCYTGYLLQDILDGKVSYAHELLKLVDILIDGRYRNEEKAPLLWRGSRNQKVYFLTDRYKHLEALSPQEGTREIELQVGKGELAMIGILEPELWERLIKALKSES